MNSSVHDKLMTEFIRRVGSRYRDCSLNNFQLSEDAEARRQQERVLFALRAFGKHVVRNVEAGRNLVLFGPVGTGKDHLLVAVMKLALEAFVPPETKPYPDPTFSMVWVNGMDLFASMRDVMDSRERTERSELNHWKAPSLLAISDPVPPSGALTDFQKAHLYRIVDARYRESKPTWVTLNVESREQADIRMGPQVVDRLKDGSLLSWCNWPSYRQPLTPEPAR